MQYWDTSTLLKMYVPEPDSSRFAGHLVMPIYTSELTRLELITRKELEGAIAPASAETVFNKFLFDVDSSRVVLLPVEPAVEARFRSLVLQLHRRSPAIVVRTFDALHLATADLLRATEVITTDPRMRAGAAAIGLKYFP
jgi:predicted nucleic acid-binding protein